MVGGLPPRRERFVQEYAKDCNATQAAIRAGYSAKVANRQGSWLLTKPDIARRIDAMAARIAERAEVKAEQVVRRLAAIALGDIGDVVTWGPDGVRVKPSEELTAQQRAQVAEISETTTPGGTVRVKFQDKIAALGLLGRHLRIFDGQQGALTTAEFDALMAAVVKLLEKNFGPERVDDALIELREIARGRYERVGLPAVEAPED